MWTWWVSRSSSAPVSRSRAEVQHQGWTDTGDFARGSGQGLFVAWDERADGRIVRIYFKAQMLADDVAHPLLVGCFRHQVLVKRA